MPVKFARSSRRHRVGRANMQAAILDAGEPECIPSDQPGMSDQFRWIGTDTRGEVLEIVAIEKPDCLLVIHAMPVKYRGL